MPTKPNLLLFIPDGMQGRVVAPDHPCQTPHFDQLAARGVTITNASTTLPTCSPARASIMTGLLPHNHGMITVEHTVDPDQSVLRRDKPHFAQALRQHGYRTAYFGKWHIERSLDLEYYGWEIDHSASGKAHRTSSEKGMTAEVPLVPELTRIHRGPTGYNDTLHYGVSSAPLAERALTRTTELAADFLCQPPEEPWCCVVSYFEPNEAMVVSQEYYDLYDVNNLPLPANLRDPLKGKPDLYRRQQAIWQDVSDDEWRQALACYYGRISEIDAQFGQLMDALEASGQADDTVVLVTSDHGKYVGAHGFEAHNCGAFEEIYNVPMVVAGPGLASGKRTSARVSIQDICPTVLELAGLPPWQDIPDSRSFAPLLRDPDQQAQHYQTAFAEYYGTRFPLCQRIYWDGPWKFVFNGFSIDELYHLEQDPYELDNLADQPDYADKVRHMMANIWKTIVETGDHTLANTHYYSMRFAAVGPDSI